MCHFRFVSNQYNPTPNTIDSLTQLLSSAKDGSTKFELVMQLGLANGSVNVDKSVQHFNEANKLAKLFKDIAYQNKIKLYSLLAILGGVVLIASIIYRSYRQKHKANKELAEKNTIISKEKKRSDDLLLNIVAQKELKN